MAVIKESPSRKIFVVINYILLLGLTLSCIIPIINLLAISLSSDAFVSQGKVGLIPLGFTMDAYEHIMGNHLVLKTFWNSIVIVICGVTYGMTITVLGAYPMSRDDRELKGRKLYVWYMVITLLFGGGLLPTFMTIKYTGLMECRVCGHMHVANLASGGHYHRGSWQCVNGCRLEDATPATVDSQPHANGLLWAGTGARQ